MSNLGLSQEITIMAKTTNTSKTKTAAAKKPASKKTTSKANSPAPKATKRAPAKRKVAPIAKRTAATLHAVPDFSIKTALAGATVGSVLSLLVGKAFFFKG